MEATGSAATALTGPLRGATLRASEEEASASDMAMTKDAWFWDVSAKGRGNVRLRKEFARRLPLAPAKPTLGTGWARTGSNGLPRTTLGTRDWYALAQTQETRFDFPLGVQFVLHT